MDEKICFGKIYEKLDILSFEEIFNETSVEVEDGILFRFNTMEIDCVERKMTEFSKLNNIKVDLFIISTDYEYPYYCKLEMVCGKRSRTISTTKLDFILFLKELNELLKPTKFLKIYGEFKYDIKNIDYGLSASTSLNDFLNITEDDLNDILNNIETHITNYNNKNFDKNSLFINRWIKMSDEPVMKDNVTEDDILSMLNHIKDTDGIKIIAINNEYIEVNIDYFNYLCSKGEKVADMISDIVCDFYNNKDFVNRNKLEYIRLARFIRNSDLLDILYDEFSTLIIKEVPVDYLSYRLKSIRMKEDLSTLKNN